MNHLYIVKSTEMVDYDEYDSVVVSALSACDAIKVARELILDCYEVGVTKISKSSLMPRGIVHDSFKAG